MQLAFGGLRCARFNGKNEASRRRTTFGRWQSGSESIEKRNPDGGRPGFEASAGRAGAAWDQCTTIFSW
jgi:hypothetical protein